MYECQVSTQPVRSYFVHLRVGGKDCITYLSPIVFTPLFFLRSLSSQVFLVCPLKTLPPEVIFRLTLEIKAGLGVLCLQHPLA